MRRHSPQNTQSHARCDPGLHSFSLSPLPHFRLCLHHSRQTRHQETRRNYPEHKPEHRTLPSPTCLPCSSSGCLPTAPTCSLSPRSLPYPPWASLLAHHSAPTRLSCPLSASFPPPLPLQSGLKCPLLPAVRTAFLSLFTSFPCILVLFLTHHLDIH